MPFYAKFVFTRTAEPASFSFLEQLRNRGVSGPSSSFPNVRRAEIVQ